MSRSWTLSRELAETVDVQPALVQGRWVIGDDYKSFVFYACDVYNSTTARTD